MKAITFKRNPVILAIILFMGLFVVSSQRGNVANAIESEIQWTEHTIAASTYPVAPRAVFAIDIDGDGDNDVVSANSDWATNNKVVWYENLGGSPPSWTEHIIYAFPQEWQNWLTDVFAIDIDGDGDVDVISAAMSGNKLVWYENLGGSPPSWAMHVLLSGALSGTIDTMPYSKGSNFGPSVFAIDINNDSHIDIVWGRSKNDFAWYENNGGSPPSFTRWDIPNSHWESASAMFVFAIDIDKDGDIDVLAGTLGSYAKLAWYENLGGSPPSWNEYTIKVGSVGSVSAIDMDKDGDMDVLISADVGGFRGFWYENDGSSPPSWTEHYIGNLNANVFAKDLDHDGDVDVLGARGYFIYWYENDGGSPPSWTRHSVGFGEWVFPIDIDKDCNIDIVAEAEDDPPVYGEVLWFENTSYFVNITKISDVGNDQGKQVRIDWSIFPCSDSLITHFTIFRRIDSLLFASLGVEPKIFSSKDYPPGRWEMVGTYPAYGETLYSATVPTLKDFTIADSMYWSFFFVRAGTDNPIIYFDSPVDSGYSLDNLSPSPPTGLLFAHRPDTTKLTWHPTSSLDFDYYTLYRGDTTGFTPNPSNRLGFRIDTTFVDSTAQLGKTYYYLVSATDFSGNESNPSNQAMGARYITGDANTDSIIDIADVVYLLNYLFAHGPAPVPLEAGDATCDSVVDASDIVYLLNYLFAHGPAPVC